MDDISNHQIENPFEKVTAEQLNNNYELIAHLFAKPQDSIYQKLISRENYVIVGGWGSGKTMLLKFFDLRTQFEYHGLDSVKSLDYLGIYIKPTRGPFKPFIEPGGTFKEGGEILFSHYFNLLILENILTMIQYCEDKSIFKISSVESERLIKGILNIFSNNKKSSDDKKEIKNINKIDDLNANVSSYRREIETFINTRDLDPDIHYLDFLTIQPTNIKSFIDEVLTVFIKETNILKRKRVYLLVDECEQFSIGQQKVINTILKQRKTTFVFKLATRPPGLTTMGTIDPGVGITDREFKNLLLDELYDPKTTDFRKLCFDVAKKRLEQYDYAETDVKNILHNFKVEDEVKRTDIESYLRNNYPNKERVKDKKKFDIVYKDFKTAAVYQILRKKKIDKQYSGFNTFVKLSSGIMLHFLELCGEAFHLMIVENQIERRNGKYSFKSLPIPSDIQTKAAKNISGKFFDNISGRAKSLKETPVNIEFGEKIQHIITIMGGVLREKLMGFNEPESMRLEIPEGLSALETDLNNPVRQIFDTAISISVFQRFVSYRPKNVGGIKPQTYILNRLLSPYFGISPSARWRTKLSAKNLNNILSDDKSIQNKILGKKSKQKKVKTNLIKENQNQVSLKLESNMFLLEYLAKGISEKYFRGKTLIIFLHILDDLIPLIKSFEKLGASPQKMILFYKAYNYPNKEKIVNYFKQNDYQIYPIHKARSVFEGLNKNLYKNALIVEDGGIIIPMLHNIIPKHIDEICGGVEQTTRGIRNDNEIEEIKFPIISIPDSDLKKTFEPTHIASAVIKSMQFLLPDLNFNGLEVLLISYGTIGEELALYLRDTLKVNLTVYDHDSDKLLKAKEKGFRTAGSINEAVKDKEIIIGATGETTISRSELVMCKHNTYLISASSEQWEFCINELEQLSESKDKIICKGRESGTKYKIGKDKKVINLIADGFPINFSGYESMPNQASDLIMSLIFLSTVELVKNTGLENEINTNIVNKIALENNLSDTYLDIYK